MPNVEWEEIESLDSFKAMPQEKQKIVRNNWLKEAKAAGPQPIKEDRGTFGDTFSHLGRGVTTAVEQVGHAISGLDFNAADNKGNNLLDRTGQGIVDWAKEKRVTSKFLRPDQGEVNGEDGFIKRGIMSGLESVPASLVPVGVGIATTALTGGNIFAGGAAGMATLGTTFGLGTYNERFQEGYKHLKESNPYMSDEEAQEQAHIYGLKHGAFELGTEAASDALMAVTFGGSKLLTQPLKSTLKDLVTEQGFKAAAKRFINAQKITMPFEVGSEMVAAAGQQQADASIGMNDQTMLEATAESIIPSIVMSLTLGGAFHAANEIEYKRIRDNINNIEDPGARERAIYSAGRQIYNEVGRRDGGEEIAKNFVSQALTHLENNTEIPLNQGIVDFAAVKAKEEGGLKDNGEKVLERVFDKEGATAYDRLWGDLYQNRQQQVDGHVGYDEQQLASEQEGQRRLTPSPGIQDNWPENQNRQQPFASDPEVNAFAQKARQYNQDRNTVETTRIQQQEAAERAEQERLAAMTPEQREFEAEYDQYFPDAPKSTATVPQPAAQESVQEQAPTPQEILAEAKRIMANEPEREEVVKRESPVDHNTEGQKIWAAAKKRLEDERNFTEETKRQQAADEILAQANNRIIRQDAPVATPAEVGTNDAEWYQQERASLAYNQDRNAIDENQYRQAQGIDNTYQQPRAGETANDYLIRQNTPSDYATPQPGELAEDYLKRISQPQAVGEEGFKTWFDTEEQANSALASMQQNGIAADHVGKAYHKDTDSFKFKIYRSQEEIDRINRESRAKWERDAKAEEAKKAEEKAKREDIKGFDSGLTPVQRGRVLKSLNKQVRHNGKVVTRKEFVESLVSDGEQLSTRQENKVKPMSRRASFRATQQEQDAHEKRIKEAGKKTVYSIGGYDVTKTEHDYAKFLQDSQPQISGEQGSKEGSANTSPQETRSSGSEVGSVSEETLEDVALNESAEQFTTTEPELTIQENVFLDTKYGRKEYILVTGNTKKHVERIKTAGKYRRWITSKKAWRFPQSQAETVKKNLTDLLQGQPAIKTGNEVATETTQQPEDSNPSVAIAERVQASIKNQVKITYRQLFKWADEAYKGTQSEGKYNVKDAYDALELGINKLLLSSSNSLNTITPSISSTPQENVSRLEKLMFYIPTQSKRTEEMDEFQQFSTPPPFAYMANWVANINKNDTYLEPSAGVGGLAVFGKKAGAKVIVNELSDRRRNLIKNLNFDRVTAENAEHLNSILPKDIQPTVIVMNPPFSATAGRIKGKRATKIGAQHIEQALKRLQPGGRLVAIVGEGMAHDKTSFKPWWKKIESEYTVRANIGVSGKGYRKYGTTFDNQILVIDKLEPKSDNIVKTGKVETPADLAPLLEDIRNERAAIQQQQVGTVQQEETSRGQGTSQADGPGNPISTSTDSMESGNREGGTRRQNQLPVSGNTGQADVPNQTGESSQVSGADRTQHNEENEQENTTSRGSKRTGRTPAQQDSSNNTRIQPSNTVEPLDLEEKTQGKSTTEISNSLYEGYRPERVKISGAKPHPTPLVQSAAMASVPPPKPTYSPSLPKKAVISGNISDIQLESVVYAGQAHEQMLPSGERQGYFIGDGTGVGKGREIASIIWDNWNKGRTKAVWISEKAPLFKDAQRDAEGVGWDGSNIFELKKTKIDKDIPNTQGVMFTTYDTLKMPGKSGQQSRIDQIVNWLGKDFDGVIAFDEAHNMGNAIRVKGERGYKEPSKKALAGVDLQQALPKARVVYVSATGATEVNNLAYADRLGVWGEGTAFANKQSFVNDVSAGGVAAMELVARDIKAMGVYNARSLSYDGVGYERLEHTLTKNQHQAYNTVAGAWQNVLQEINAALEETGGGGRAKGAAYSAFWGAHQRFFNQFITSLQMPSVLKEIKKDIEKGNAVVIQMTNTFEAAQDRAVAKLESGQSLEDLDISPFDSLMMLVEKSFPVTQYQQYEDDNGNIRWEPVKDSEGNIVENAEAVAMREKLLDELGSLRSQVADNPLDQIIDEFGHEKVAEVTGRSRRFVWVNEDGAMVKKEQKRGNTAGPADAQAFMDDKKQILIFSDAGGTGRSYHADNNAKNKRKRVHYLLQPGWRADKAIQGLGRTHRSNQAQPPLYKLVTTNLKGQKRFLSSIARRLEQLGALTKGQRQTGNQGIFNARDNLESQYAKDALRQFFGDLFFGRIEGLTIARFELETGLKLTNEETGQLTQNLPDIRQFLNRLLSLDIETQDLVFDAFSQRIDDIIETHVMAGTLDQGVETLVADKVEKVSETLVNRDDRTGAETTYVQLKTERPAKRLPFSGSRQYAKDGYYQNKTSGKVWAVTYRHVQNRKTGDVVEMSTLISPSMRRQNIPKVGFTDEKWTKVNSKQAKPLWEKDYNSAPSTITDTEHLLTGALLPIWDRLSGNARVMRVQTSEGEKMIGRLIPSDDINNVLSSLGVDAKGNDATVQVTPQQAFSMVLDQNFKIKLANGWTLERKRVSDDDRIEIKNGFNLQDMQNHSKHGVFSERIQWQTRFFVPTSEQGVQSIEKLMVRNPVVSATPPAGSKYGAADGESIMDALDGDTKLSTSTITSTPANIQQELTSALGRKLNRLLRGPLHIVGQEEAQGVLKQWKDKKYSVVWHGTPHRGIDQFSTDAIGTGEGAQAYGWGLYFADKKEVAEWYREGLSDAIDTIYLYGDRYEHTNEGWQHEDGGIVEYDSPEAVALNSFLYGGDDIIGDLQQRVKEAEQYEESEIGDIPLETYREAIKILQNEEIKPGKQGQLYKVEIPDDDVMLHWDKPLSEQPEKVREALKSLPDNTKNGKEIYYDIAENFHGVRNSDIDGGNGWGGFIQTINDREGNHQKASNYLNSLGIKGIKYLDGMSRDGSGEGYNYVIFDGANTRIIDVKYSKDGQIQGFTTPDGNVYLVQDGIEKGKAMSVLAHEMGVHLNKLGFKQDKDFQSVLNAIKRNQGKSTKLGKLIDEAASRVPSDTNAEYHTEEILAYLVENNPDTGIVRRFIALVKKWLVEKVGISAGIFNADDLHALALAAIDQQAGIGTGERVKMSVQEKFRPVDTESAAFKEWFGESVVRTPVYHHSPDIINKFDHNLSGDIGFHFGTEPAAKQRAEQIGTGSVEIETEDGPRQIDYDSKLATKDNVSKMKDIKDILYFTLLRKLDDPRIDLRDQVNSMSEDSAIRAYEEYINKKDSKKYKQRVKRANSKPVSRVLVNGEVIGEFSSYYAAKKAADQQNRVLSKPIKAYLKIENPIRLPDLGVWSALDIAEKSNFSKDEFNVVANKNSNKEKYQAVREILKNKGYDGIVYTNEVEDAGSDSYIAFSPTQIKSAISNTGAFSESDPRIQYSKKQTPFQKWFGNSKITKNGQPHILYHGTQDTQFLSDKETPWVFDTKRKPNKTSSPLAGLGIFLGDADIAAAHSGFDGTVHPFYVRMENPYVTTSAELEKKVEQSGTKQFKKRLQELSGHDGIIITDRGHAVVFDPNQVKSAAENIGAYSLSNDDVRYSVANAASTYKNIATETTRTRRKIVQQAKKGADKYLGAISTRLNNINPKLKEKFRRLDFNIGTRQTADVKNVEPLLEKAKQKMSKVDYVTWDIARKHGDKVTIDSIVEKYGLAKEYGKYRETLDKIRKEANEVGLNVGYLEEYAPRVLKDPEGFLEAIGKGPEWDNLSRALKAAADNMDMPVAAMPMELRADIISNALLRGGSYGMSRPGNTKERVLARIPESLQQYYMASDAALMHYIYQMRKNIEYRRFFGKVPEHVTKTKTALKRAIKAKNEELKNPTASTQRINDIQDTIDELQAKLDRYRNSGDFREEISTYIADLITKREISPGDEGALIDIFNARFHDRGTRGLIQGYKNLSYIDTMGSPISALTQIGDLAWTAYENGFIPSLKHAYRSLKGKSKITREDIGIERIAQEFADSDTLSNAVSKVFRMVGLEKMDTIGKEAMLNASLEKAQKRAKKDTKALRKELLPIFEGEVDSVIDDLQRGGITENVKLYVYSKLLDYQPAAPSEMPEQYLRAGNGRLFYMLKTYTLKQFDVYRNQVYNKIKTGDKAQQIEGIKNLVKLSAFIVLANAGADEIKDFVLGRKTDLSDRVTDNILRLFGVSKFVTWKARTDGIGSALIRQILPPFKFVDALSKDIATAGDEKGLETVSSIPLVGKLAYWHMGRGQAKRDDLWDARFRREKRALNRIKEKVESNPDQAKEYATQLARLRYANRIQYRANKLRQRAKTLEQNGANKRTIEKVNERREAMIKAFLQNK